MNKLSNSTINRTTAVATLSSAFECYDFVIYAALIPYISQIFFPASSSIHAINALLVFAIGYISRPLGGLLFGTIGDKYGRKKTFVITIWLMALSTFAIGLLPSYGSVGIISPCLLICCRFIQGLSQGGEVPGAIIFVAEHAKSNSRSKHCAFIFLGLGVGSLLSAFVCYLLSIQLTQSEIIDWGWRIPFLVGGVLGLISTLVRRTTQETSDYLKQKKLGIEKNPIITLVKYYKKDLATGVFLAVLAASLITFTLTLPVYLKSFINLSTPDTYFLMSIGMLTMAMLAPLFGILADTLGPLKLLKYSMANSIVIIPISMHYAAHYSTLFSIILMVIIIQAFIASMLGTFPVMLANLFPAKVRYTGVAFSYNVAFTMAAFIPAIISYILLVTNEHVYVGLLFSGVGVISLLFLATSKLKYFLSIEINNVKNNYLANKFS